MDVGSGRTNDMYIRSYERVFFPSLSISGFDLVSQVILAGLRFFFFPMTIIFCQNHF